MGKQKQAYIYAIVAVIIWSTVASAFKVSLRHVDFLQLVFYASIVSILVLFIILVTKKSYIYSKHTQKKII